MMDIYESENFIEIDDGEMNKNLFEKVKGIISKLDCEIIDCSINGLRCYDLFKTVESLKGDFEIHILLMKRGETWQSTLM